MELASQFKAARVRLGLSQSEAALAWSVKKRALEEWEQGRTRPRGKTLERLWPILFAGPAASAPPKKKR